MYDFLGATDSIPLNEIIEKPILFSVCTHKSAFKVWRKIGNVPLDENLKKLIPSFIQDKFNLNDCSLMDENGNEKQVTPYECIGVERSAVWSAEHVEQRALDELNGRENNLAKELKVRLPDN